MHTAMLPEIVNRRVHMTVRELLDGLFQCRVLLPNDFVKVRRVHSCFLKLLEWSPGLYSLVLSGVTHQNNPVLFLQPVYEFVDLPCAREARFVHNVQVSFRVVSLRSGKMALQGNRMDACIFKLVGGAGSGR